MQLLNPEKDHYSNVFLQFNATETTNITCRASNFVTPLNQTIQDTREYEIYVQKIDGLCIHYLFVSFC